MELRFFRRLIILFFIISFQNVQLVNAQENQYAKGYLWRQSRESVITLQTDSAKCQELVGDSFQIKTKDGKALVMIVTQDILINYCNSEEAGPSHEILILIAIQDDRIADWIPVVGAPGTIGTMSWFNVFGGTSGNEMTNFFQKSGLFFQLIEDISLEIKSDGVKGVVKVNGETSLRWQSEIRPRGDQYGVNHIFYMKDPNGRIICNQGQALCIVKSLAAPGILEITGDLGMGEFLKAGTYSVKVNAYDPIWLRASFNIE